MAVMVGAGDGPAIAIVDLDRGVEARPTRYEGRMEMTAVDTTTFGDFRASHQITGYTTTFDVLWDQSAPPPRIGDVRWVVFDDRAERLVVVDWRQEMGDALVVTLTTAGGPAWKWTSPEARERHQESGAKRLADSLVLDAARRRFREAFDPTYTDDDWCSCYIQEDDDDDGLD